MEISENTASDTSPVDAPDVTPQSSGGPEDGGPSSILDAIKETEQASSSENEPQVADAEEGPAISDADPYDESIPEDPDQTPKVEAEEAPEEDVTAELPDEPTEEELKHMSARTKRRIDKLLSERRDARQEAEKGRPIVSFMEQNDIPLDDADVVLNFAAQLRKGDFAGFLRSVDPYLQLAQAYTGDILPQDLQEQVHRGTISPTAAKELAAHRSSATVQQQQAQRVQERTEGENRALRGQAIKDAVTHWEQSTKAADPDYEAKADIVRRTSQALMQERGAPGTPEQALAYVKEAYDEASRMIGRFQPKPRATPVTPSSVNQTAQTARPEPSSMLDVVRQAAAGR